MLQTQQTIIGIDVGGERKGFHAVALRDGDFFDKITNRNPKVIFDWCVEIGAGLIGVDAPCAWSAEGKSRKAERDLNIGGEKIHCFATPTRKSALNRAFYDWVFNGEKLYKLLETRYPLFNPKCKNGRACFETFPHAVICALAGRIVSSKPKVANRRKALRSRGYDDTVLPNIDFVDAALCALTAHELSKGNRQIFGDPEEGYIVVPEPNRVLK